MSTRNHVFAMTFIGCIGIAAAAFAAPPVAVEQRSERSAPPAAAPPVLGTSRAASALGLYTPPACAGIFSDVACPGGFAVNWIEQLANDGITAGCGGGNYCPDNPVTRAQMAVFLEKAMRGTANWPAHSQIVWAVKNPDGTPNLSASGTALLDAVAAIPTSGNDMPSAGNPWLVKIGPGVFDLGAATVSVPQNVSLEGSGMDATVLQGTATSPEVIYCAGYGEVSSLSVYSTGTGTQAVGMWLGGPTRLRGVSVWSQGAGTINVAVVTNHFGNSFFTDVELQGIGGQYARALENQNATGVVLRGGILEGTGGSIYNTTVLNLTGNVWAASTQFLLGAVTGTATCAGVYDGAFGFFASTCP